MRLKSEFWVKAYLRRAAAEAIAAHVVRHGDDDAGAIYIKVARLDGTAALFGPAPAGLIGRDGERRWSQHAPAGTTEAAVDDMLARQKEFDPDIWIVEIESRQDDHLLHGWLDRDGARDPDDA
jgi:hypothetical protein